MWIGTFIEARPSNKIRAREADRPKNRAETLYMYLYNFYVSKYFDL